VPGALARWPRSERDAKGDATRAAVLAALHNCFCPQKEDVVLDDDSSSSEDARRRARELAGDGDVVASLVEGVERCELNEELLESHAAKSDEWTYLLACALLRRGAASLFFETCRARGLSLTAVKLATDCVDSEDDGVFAAKDDAVDDVAAAALRLAKASGESSVEEACLRLAGDAAGLGPKSRAEALTAAGLLDLLLHRYLDRFPVPSLKLLANVTWFDPRARDAARPLIPKVLSCTKVDPNTFLSREWAVFTVRNLCHENPANQQFIANLQPQALDTDPDTLRSIGLKSASLYDNPDTGKKEIKVDVIRPPSKRGQPAPPPPVVSEEPSSSDASNIRFNDDLFD